MTHAKLQKLAQNGLSQAGETARETRGPEIQCRDCNRQQVSVFGMLCGNTMCVCPTSISTEGLGPPKA